MVASTSGRVPATATAFCSAMRTTLVGFLELFPVAVGATRHQLALAIYEWIEAWYNPPAPALRGEVTVVADIGLTLGV